MADILVLGATGFTGRLITRYLYNHPQRASFSLAIGVRSKSKGEALQQSLGLDESVKLVQLDVTRYDQIDAAVKDSKVVINAVGPFWRWGTNVVRACALHGKRYVDLTGEPHFIRKILDNFDYLATKTGAIIVPACGLDSIPADITTYLSNRTIKNALGPQAELGLSQTFYSLRTKPSGGSSATLISMLEDVPRLKLEEAQSDYALSLIRGGPSPSPRLATPMPFSSPAKYGALWVMESANRAVVQRTYGLNQFALTSARALYGEKHLQEKTEQLRPLSYGPKFRYAEYVIRGRGSFFSTVLYSTIVATVMSLLYVTPIRWLVKKIMSKSGEGPTEEEMKKGFLKVTNYTATASTPETWAKTVMSGKSDPGYLLTATMISECALGLLLDDASLPFTARPGGVLTPATALGEVIVRRLEATGQMRFETEIVSGSEESRKQR
ncbi:Saccharopine dehydrogenase-domain-containing protein [Trametes meyenii]|nr:Saccharopine dehydrogenase-domain-containing protein [Trametes meyenii]